MTRYTKRQIGAYSLLPFSTALSLASYGGDGGPQSTPAAQQAEAFLTYVDGLPGATKQLAKLPAAARRPNGRRATPRR
ncbi:hypothetical protein [Burkholderia sp. Bp8963]|uniref:hypothetical protein n=1 Tax=Burkholderia sp. Bp8963 TaxID=2184547 RepID=UPI00163A0714|nr:hypothetical protein [Burkholderia sp. Bp8963]